MSFSQEEIAKGLKAIEGDRIIGVLPETLQGDYCEMINAEAQVEELLHMYNLRQFENVVDKARTTLETLDYSNMNEKMLNNGLFDNEAEAVEFFKKTAMFEALRWQFWYSLRSCFQGQEPGVWNLWCEVRSEFRVVSTGKKFSK